MFFTVTQNCNRIAVTTQKSRKQTAQTESNTAVRRQVQQKHEHYYRTNSRESHFWHQKSSMLRLRGQKTKDVRAWTWNNVGSFSEKDWNPFTKKCQLDQYNIQYYNIGRLFEVTNYTGGYKVFVVDRSDSKLRLTNLTRIEPLRGGSKLLSSRCTRERRKLFEKVLIK